MLPSLELNELLNSTERLSAIGAPTCLCTAIFKVISVELDGRNSRKDDRVHAQLTAAGFNLDPTTLHPPTTRRDGTRSVRPAFASRTYTRQDVQLRAPLDVKSRLLRLATPFRPLYSWDG